MKKIQTVYHKFTNTHKMCDTLIMHQMVFKSRTAIKTNQMNNNADNNIITDA